MTARKTASAVERAGTESLALLHDVLRPLARHYERADLSEIAICAPTVVFHRLRRRNRFGECWREAHDPRLTHDYLTLVLESLAHVFDVPFHPRTHPTLADTELPGGHRLTAVVGQGVVYDTRRPEGGVSICIRQGSQGRAPLELEAWKIDADGEAHAAWKEQMLRTVSAPASGDYQKVLEAAHAGRPLLLSGPTDTGKTSLLNRLLLEIDDDTRVICVEDQQELRVPVKNRVHLMTSRTAADAAAAGKLSPEDVRNTVVRSSPDALLIGEISPANAALAVQLLHTGHTHCWTSIHAENPTQAIDEFAALAAQPQPGVAARDEQENRRLLSEQFIVIQTQRRKGERYIDEIRYPPDMGEPE